MHVEGMISKKERRIFLFEQAVVIAKKTKAPKGSLMSEVFQAKVLLRVSEDYVFCCAIIPSDCAMIQCVCSMCIFP